jgi:hypothetical protein
MRAMYVAQLRGDNEPTRRALAMAEAILQHIEDVQEDDAGDRDDRAMWQQARSGAEDVVAALRFLLR